MLPIALKQLPYPELLPNLECYLVVPLSQCLKHHVHHMMLHWKLHGVKCIFTKSAKWIMMILLVQPKTSMFSTCDKGVHWHNKISTGHLLMLSLKRPTTKTWCKTWWTLKKSPSLPVMTQVTCTLLWAILLPRTVWRPNSCHQGW